MCKVIASCDRGQRSKCVHNSIGKIEGIWEKGRINNAYGKTDTYGGKAKGEKVYDEG